MAVDPKTLTDTEKLRNLMANAKRLGRDDLVLECQLRIAELAGQQFDDELDKEFWAAVTAAEEFKTAENGKTTRLSRTRQKYSRDGARKTISDVASKSGFTDGFAILEANGRLDLSFEAIMLKHQDRFEPSSVEAIRDKLLTAGVDASVIDSWSL